MLDVYKKLISLKKVDLSHKIDQNCPNWENQCGFKEHVLLNYGHNLFKTQKFEMLGGIGTHLDSPSAFI